jgi:hypothetical protein
VQTPPLQTLLEAAQSSVVCQSVQPESCLVQVWTLEPEHCFSPSVQLFAQVVTQLPALHALPEVAQSSVVCQSVQPEACLVQACTSVPEHRFSPSVHASVQPSTQACSTQLWVAPQVKHAAPPDPQAVSVSPGKQAPDAQQPEQVPGPHVLMSVPVSGRGVTGEPVAPSHPVRGRSVDAPRSSTQ